MNRPFPTTPEGWRRYRLLDEERVALGHHFEAEMERLGLSEKQYAASIGKPRAFVQQHRLLARAEPAVAEALTRREISFTAARVISRSLADEPALQLAALSWVRAAVADGQDPTEDQVMARVSELRAGSSVLPAAGSSPSRVRA